MYEEQELDNALVEQVPAGDGSSTGSESRQSAQVIDWSQVDWAKVKLDPDKIPAFQQLKSTLQRQVSSITEMSKRERDRADRLEADLIKQRMEGMTQTQAAEYRAYLAEQKANARMQEADTRIAAVQRDADLTLLSSELGVPKNVIEDADTPLDAALKAAKWLKTNGDTRSERSEAARAERALANQVDTGSGPPSDVRSDLQRRLDKAVEKFEAGEQLDILYEARMKGITLKY